MSIYGPNAEFLGGRRLGGPPVGSKVFIQGKMQTRKWQDQSGADKYSTEIVLQGFNATLVMLDGKQDAGGGGYTQNQSQGGQAGEPAGGLDDEIPFTPEWRV